MNPPFPRRRTVFLVIEGLTTLDSKLPSLAALTARSTVSRVAPPLHGSRLAALGTLATGAWPDQHGLLLAALPTADGTAARPIEAADRRRGTLWELLDLHGVPGIAVGWPAVAGSELRNSVAVDAGFGAPGVLPGKEPLARRISPTSKAPAVAECWMKPDELDLTTLAALVPAWEQVEQARDPRLAILAGTVAHSVSRHAAFLELLASHPWESASLVLQLPAELARLEASSTANGDGIFEGLGERGLVLLDAFIGAVLEQIPADTVVVVCGLAVAEPTGPTPPAGIPAGFLLLHGPGVIAGARIQAANLLDLAPTLWRMHGHAAPWAAGRPLVEALQEAGEPLDFTTPWQPPAPLPAGENSPLPDPAWLTRWQMVSLQLRAFSLMARGEWLSAMPLLERQLGLQPDSVALLALLVECQYFAGLHREALANAWDLLDLEDPAEPLPWLMVAGLEAITGGFAKARELLDEALPKVAGRPAARLFHGRVLIHLRQWQEAKTVLQALIRDEPENAEALGQLARAHLGLREWLDAGSTALRATALNLQDAQTHEILGTALQKIGMHAEAWKAFGAATRITPSWPRPWARQVQLARVMKREPAEILQLTERYRQASALARDKQRVYLDSVKELLQSREEAVSSENPALSDPSPFPLVPPADIASLVYLSGTPPEVFHLLAGIPGLPVAGGAETGDPFWQPLLDAPATRAELPLEEGWLYRMPVAIPARLPKRHSYRLIAVHRDPLVVVNDRAHLPKHLAGLDHEDLLAALAQERSGLAHLAEFSTNLRLLEVTVDELQDPSGPAIQRVMNFLGR